MSTQTTIPDWETFAAHLHAELGYTDVTLKRTQYTYKIFVRQFYGTEGSLEGRINQGIEHIRNAFEAGEISKDKLLRLRRIAFRLLQLIKTGKITWDRIPLYGKKYGNEENEATLAAFVLAENRSHNHAKSIIKRDENIIRQYILFAESQGINIINANTQEMTGEKAFILPTGLKGGDMPLMPYVFTPESLNAFFSFTDTMERYYQSTVRHLVAPVMFRYMYCCGLRPAEARRLNREDVDLKTGRIFIQESKYNKERIVYAPEELLSLTRAYLQQISSVFPNSVALFVDREGRHIPKDSHQYLFEVCRGGSGIRTSGTKQPNLYSFRHSFATHRIYQWYKEGKNIDSLLPGLSAYMGHSQLQNTLYYLHFLPELFSNMAGFDFEQFSEIVPEVNEDD